MQHEDAFPHESFTALRDALHRGRVLSRNPRLASMARALDSVTRHLSRPMRLAVMGEENSGKSSLINMLLRESVVPAGALAGVRARLLVRYGAEAALHAVSPDGSRARLTTRALAKMAVPEVRATGAGNTVIYNAFDPARQEKRSDARPGASLTMPPPAPAENAAKLIDITLPRDLLRRLELIETRLYPEDAERKALQTAFQPIDLAIWCTLATQAWKETERQAWRRMPAGLSRNAVLVVTYKDAIHRAKDEEKLIGRLKRETGSLFTDILLLSPRHALDAMSPRHALDAMSPLGEISDTARWERSGAAAFEAALQARMSAFNRRRTEKGAALLYSLSAETERHARDSLPAALADTIALHFGQAVQDIEQRLVEQSTS